jgi:hypothetical protein
MEDLAGPSGGAQPTKAPDAGFRDRMFVSHETSSP